MRDRDTSRGRDARRLWHEFQRDLRAGLRDGDATWAGLALTDLAYVVRRYAGRVGLSSAQAVYCVADRCAIGSPSWGWVRRTAAGRVGGYYVAHWTAPRGRVVERALRHVRWNPAPKGGAA